MSLDHDLLRHARDLAERAPKRPKQANIRRAISAAYYAVFHLLTRAAARAFADGNESLIPRLARTFNHGDMAKASKGFAKRELPQLLRNNSAVDPVPPELSAVAEAFSKLQESRHTADYDGGKVFQREEAVEAVKLAEEAFQKWETVATSSAARWYLMCFSLWDTWNKPAR